MTPPHSPIDILGTPFIHTRTRLCPFSLAPWGTFCGMTERRQSRPSFSLSVSLPLTRSPQLSTASTSPTGDPRRKACPSTASSSRIPTDALGWGQLRKYSQLSPVASPFTDATAWREGIAVGCAVLENGAADGDEHTSKRKKAATRHPGTLAVEMVSTASQPCCFVRRCHDLGNPLLNPPTNRRWSPGWVGGF